MIYYEVFGGHMIYENQNEIDFRKWNKQFKDNNPLKARKQAFEFFQKVLHEMAYNNEDIDKLFSASKEYLEKLDQNDDDWESLKVDIIFKMGLGVNLIIEDSFNKKWKNFVQPYEVGLNYLGEKLEEWTKESIEMQIEDIMEEYGEDEEVVRENASDFAPEPDPVFKLFSFKHAKNQDSYTIDKEFKNLCNENAIYDYLSIDKSGVETTVDYYNLDTKTLEKHTILKVPFDWNEFANIQINKHKRPVKEIEEVNQELLQEALKKIKNGEGSKQEFKSSLTICHEKGKSMSYIKEGIAKVISAFLNTEGGILYVGVDDNGKIIGLENEHKSNNSSNKRDKLKQKLDNIIRDSIGSIHSPHIDVEILNYEGKDFMEIRVGKSEIPVYFSKGNKQEYYIKSTASIQPLNLEKAVKYIINKFDAKSGMGYRL